MEHLAFQIHQHLQEKAQHVLLVPHPRPDGDTLSAASAFMQYLKRMKKKHSAYCKTPVPQELMFLPDAHRVGWDKRIFTQQKFDTIVTFDTGDLVYAGLADILPTLPYQPTIINIDHHYTNTRYGQHNFVMVDAASTTEVLYHYFKHIGAPIDPDMATALLTGLVTDTGNFSNQATTTRSVGIASELLRAGAQMDIVLAKTFRNKTIRGLKMWGLMLSRLTHNQEHDIAYTFVRQEDLALSGVSYEEVDGLSNFLNSLGEGKAILVLYELGDGTVKGSMRTTRDDVDVSRWAKRLGGGGHKKAAGFTIENARITDGASAWAIFESALSEPT